MSRRLGCWIRAIPLVWAALVSMWSPRLLGQTATESDRAEKSEHLLQDGRQAFEAKRYPEAHARLSQAYRLHQSYRTACALGQVELELQMYRDAAEHLDICITRYPDDDPQQARERVLEGLRETRRHVAVLDVDVNLLGATILINGVEVGTTPLDADLYVEPGRRRVTVRKAGYRDASEELFFPAGGTLRWRAVLAAGNSESVYKVNSVSTAPYLGIGTALTVLTLAGAGTLSLIAHTESARAERAVERAASNGSCPTTSTRPDCTAARRQLDEAARTSELATATLWAGAGMAVVTAIVHWVSSTASEPEQSYAAQVSPLLQPIVHPDLLGAVWSSAF